ncbi:DUF6167 family protein [Nocardioides sp. 1609]|uniref:DUF6167 family protein n=1 Tax=Nocardioides sp. 1609 TaxID=2508327 RepID=UPI001431450B|nr:DUF6167 family protein [Nocardioides sp. 1609]
MGRSIWFAAGVGAGAYAVVRVRRAAEILTVDGLRDRVGAAVVGVRMFRDEVAQGRADAETGLRERMGLALHDHRELAAPADDLASTTPDQITGGDSTTEQEVGRS